jgi:protein Tob/BTG
VLVLDLETYRFFPSSSSSSSLTQILYSEQKHDSPDDNNADREVTTTFNPEAQCFRPIEIINSTLNALTLSPKSSPNDSSPTSSTSPMYGKNNSPSGNANGGSSGSATATATFLGRQQEPVLFTTATFAQTKFGSTKLKNNSKRTNR